MSSTVRITVAAGSQSDVLIQLLDTTPKPAGYIPIQAKLLRMRPGHSHELIVGPGVSLCLVDAEPLPAP